MDIRIQHIKVIKKSDVPHFYQEMLLTFSFNENLTSLIARSRYRTSVYLCVFFCTYALHIPANEKQDALFLPITSPNIDRFSKNFHRQTQQGLRNE